ncbi:hypothetical protein [Hymenobacter weizhouensis]|uniref:hypothetical protein n=1 Tax=Hymenobacter sp. YIM 151500-1 TaxID=2987689 RepID=UPI0022261522|nr:hypothetical protein [Hymenobacter sp. YIM 151500-1]UYZ63943.1 hypothetical protein OIS53_03650 [Hymenobacter sp. YIM 151500-1]
MAFDQLSQDEKEAQFAAFLLNMEDDVDELVEEAEQAGYALDFSVNSLYELERYVLDMGVSFQDSSDTALLLRSKCWEYLGEVVVKNYNGRWKLSDNEENSANRGMFVVVGHSYVEGIEFVPARYLRMFTTRRKPGMLVAILESDVNPPKSALDDFVFLQ